LQQKFLVLTRAFLFSNLFIAVCAFVMTGETLVFYTTSLLYNLLPLRHGVSPWTTLVFVAAGTLFAYNIHWLLGIGSSHDSERLSWTRKYRTPLVIISLLALGLAAFAFLNLRWAWLFVLPAVLVTGMYTLPKVDAFRALRAFAYGKTMLLALSWTYVTTAMPVLVAGAPLGLDLLFFMMGRFFLVYAICLLFDHRDVEADLSEGLTTLPARISETQLKAIFFSSVFLSMIFMTLSVFPAFHFQNLKSENLLLAFRLLPALLLSKLYKRATNPLSPTPHPLPPIASYLLFYGILDGLMMLSGILSLALAF
jgi:4-hydroxybenzoate polyprenyltransferase